jgi:hypothetical protein
MLMSYKKKKEKTWIENNYIEKQKFCRIFNSVHIYTFEK